MHEISPTNSRSMELTGEDCEAVTRNQTEAKSEYLNEISPQSMQLGQCYATEYFACGYFDGKGGVVEAFVSNGTRLSIPPAALQKKRLMWCIVYYDSCIEDVPKLCPAIECGSSTSEFQVPVKITLSHCLQLEDRSIVPKAHHFKIKTRREIGDQWEDFSPVKFADEDVTRSTLSFYVNHFSGYTAVPAEPQDNQNLLMKFQCAVFANDHSVKVFIIPNYAANEAELHKIKDRQAEQEYKLKSDWEDFSLVDEGAVMLETKPFPVPRGYTATEARQERIDVQDLMGAQKPKARTLPLLSTRESSQTAVTLCQGGSTKCQTVLPSTADSSTSNSDQQMVLTNNYVKQIDMAYLRLHEIIDNKWEEAGAAAGEDIDPQSQSSKEISSGHDLSPILSVPLST